MNPIERLEALLEKYGARSRYRGPTDNYTEAVEADKTVVELRSIIEALKQQDEAVRKVAEEMESERSITTLMPRKGTTIEKWAARLRAALEGKHE